MAGGGRGGKYRKGGGEESESVETYNEIKVSRSARGAESAV